MLLRSTVCSWHTKMCQLWVFILCRLVVLATMLIRNSTYTPIKKLMQYPKCCYKAEICNSFLVIMWLIYHLSNCPPIHQITYCKHRMCVSYVQYVNSIWQSYRYENWDKTWSDYNSWQLCVLPAAAGAEEAAGEELDRVRGVGTSHAVMWK